MTHSTRTRRPGRGPAAGQQALLTAATRRGPVTGCTPAAERSHVTGRDDRELSFADLPAENPNLLTAAADPAPVVVEELAPSPLRAGHEHAGPVLHGLRAETPRLHAPDEHTVHHQLPRGFELRVVPLIDPEESEPFWTADPFTLACQASIRNVQIFGAEHVASFVPGLHLALNRATVELDTAIARLGIAAADLARLAGGRLALLPVVSAVAALINEPAQLSEVDHRPVTPVVGFDLETAVAA